MSEPKAIFVQNRFEARPNPEALIFFDDVPSTYIEDLRAWVRTRGTPDLWRWNLQTAPPKDSPVPKIIAEAIEVPEQLRSKVGRAPCPICSISHPKYFSGILVQYKLEGALRVIGHECGKRLYGQSFTDAKTAFTHERKKQAAFYFLVNNARNILNLARSIDEFAELARKIDSARDQFRRAVGKAHCDTLSKHALELGGSLRLYETRHIPSLDRYGNYQFDAEGEVLKHPQDNLVRSDPFLGAEVLRGNGLAVALLARAHNQLGSFPYTDQELEQIEGPDLIAFETKARSARSLFVEARDLCLVTQRLLSDRNMAVLADWSASRLNPLKLQLKMEFPGRFICGVGKGARVLITAKSELRARLPDEITFHGETSEANSP